MTLRNRLALAIGLWVVSARIPFPHDREGWARIEQFNAAPFSLYLQHGLV